MNKSIEITLKAGSKFQEKTAAESLIVMLRAWKAFYSSSHKKNKIEIFVDGWPVEKVKP